MFNHIPENILKRMAELTELDKQVTRVRQVPPETGKFLALIAASAPGGTWLELGTSMGYSALWLSLACRVRGTRLITVDKDPAKVEIAKQTFIQAGVEDIVEVIHGDSIEQLQRFDDLGFCFIDAAGGVGTYDHVVPRMKDGGIFVYDNILNHAERARPTVEKALADDRVDALVVPIGNGELLCRRLAR